MSDAVLIALIGVFGSIAAGAIAAAAAYFAAKAAAQGKETHQLINSRMDELLAAARALSRAEGVAAGEQAQRDRTAESQSPPDRASPSAETTDHVP